MTRTHYEGVGLPRLVHESHGILRVRPADPPTRVEPASILPAGSAYLGRNVPPYYEPPYHDPDPGPHADRNYPPYVRCWHRLDVTAVLKAAPGLAVADFMEICEGNSEAQEDLHRMYYLEGRRKSPIYEAYRSDLPIDEGSERLVFCTQRAGRVALTVAFAFESLDRRAEVAALIAGGPPNTDWYPEPS